MKKLSKKWWVLLIVILFLIILIIFGLFIFGKDSESTGSSGGSTITVNGKKVNLVSCTSTASDQPQEYAGWTTSLYAASLKSESSNPGTQDNGARNFSISQLKAKTSSNSLYYRIEKTNGDKIAGAKSIVEICNSDNKTKMYETTATTTTTSASADATAVIIYLHGGGVYYIEKPGNYRADAYLYTDGSWHLTDRINNITFTE